MGDITPQEQLDLIATDLRGVALIADVAGGDVGLVAAHVGGNADHVNVRANNLDTRFATASAGKAFVAVAIMQLVEKGQLALDTPVHTVIDHRVHGSWGEATIEQLLTHTSGVPDYFDEDVMTDYAELWHDLPNYRIRSSADLLPLFASEPATSPAGARFSYNNSGYVLLGLVVEHFAGVPFDEYLALEVFRPAGMTRTGYYELDRLPQGCAHNYIRDDKDEWYSNIYSVDVKGTGAGGAFTTMHDVARFWAALSAGVLLAPDTVELMWTVHAREGSDCYGYGFWLDATEHGVNPRFEGSDPGVAFVSSFDRETGMVLALVSNYGDNVWAMRRELISAFRGSA